MKPLSKQPSVGDIVIRIAETDSEFIEGHEYAVFSIDNEGDSEVLDKYGNKTAILDYELVRFSLKEDVVDDPGELAVMNFVEIQDDLYEVTITANKKAFDNINALAAQHRKAVEATRIKAQIAELEKKLKEL